jgi:hypothetical protein
VAQMAFGEIRTGLLRHSRALDRAATGELLALVPGERVRDSQRPIAHAVSPEVADGLDCELAVGADGRGRTRVVGTALTHGVVVGGRVVQACSYARVDPAGSQRRREWAYYTGRPGVLEPVARADPGRLADGFLAGGEGADCADVSALSDRLVRRIQGSPMLDGKAPLRFQWTRLRWSAVLADPVGAAAPSPRAAADFVLVDDTLRTLRLTAAADLGAVVELCRDLALHDWILTTLTQRFDRLPAPDRDREQAVAWLRPVIDHLLHLWMPGARVDPALAALWAGFERRPGFTRQWDATVARVRDQVALHTLQLLGEPSRQGVRIKEDF